MTQIAIIYLSILLAILLAVFIWVLVILFKAFKESDLFKILTHKLVHHRKEKK